MAAAQGERGEGPRPGEAASLIPPPAALPVAVYGAGAVGCFYGGLLARAGHEVTLIGRAGHMDAIAHDGLRIEMDGAQFSPPVQACTTPEGLRGAGLVLVCVKSYDSESAAREMRPLVRPDAVVLSLQNGVHNAQLLADRMGRPVFPVAVYVAVGMAGPGRVRHHGRNELIVPDALVLAPVVAALRHAGIPVQASDNVEGALWVKLVANCAFNGLSALTRQPYGPLFQADGVPRMLRAISDECRAVATALGVRMDADPWEGVERIARTMPTQISSTAQDLIRGRRTEIDALNGHVVELGARLGVPTPVNQAILTLVHLAGIESAAKCTNPSSD